MRQDSKRAGCGASSTSRPRRPACAPAACARPSARGPRPARAAACPAATPPPPPRCGSCLRRWGAAASFGARADCLQTFMLMYSHLCRQMILQPCSASQRLQRGSCAPERFAQYKAARRDGNAEGRAASTAAMCGSAARAVPSTTSITARPSSVGTPCTQGLQAILMHSCLHHEADRRDLGP